VGITPEPGILFGEGGTKEYKYNPGTKGNIAVTIEDPGPRIRGRQSWRQVR
jgi:type IV pilus assembly protein PilY1